MSVPGESKKSIQDALHDQFRADYYKGYIEALSSARKSGVNVLSYFAWSIIDNFEWSAGLGIRFGMVYVDYKDN